MTDWGRPLKAGLIQFRHRRTLQLVQSIELVLEVLGLCWLDFSELQPLKHSQPCYRLCRTLLAPIGQASEEVSRGQ